MNRTETPVAKDLVLIGGGHSHVAVLKNFGMQPMPGVRLTLICKDVSTPYSGMLPGFMAGHYEFDEAHIDLRPLCHFAGAQFCQAMATGLDLANKRVLCVNRPPVGFDLLSVNIGSTPRAQDIPGAAKYALPVKPIDRFLKGWEEIIERALRPSRSPLRMVVVGGGAGGVELTLATRHHLEVLLSRHGGSASSLEFHLVAASGTVLPTHNLGAQRKFTRILRERGVHLHLDHRVVEVAPNKLHCAPGQPVFFDVLLWVTNAAAPAWIGQSGLHTDADGFLAVNDCLQSISHPFVFAAGDIAAVAGYPRPKSGVFAVRQGAPLAENLRLALAGKSLQPFAPQKQFLSLISTGDKYAVASRSWWALEGQWVWKVKDWIDRRWMEKYQKLPDMRSEEELAMASDLASPEELKELSTAARRCGGCGAKVGSSVLSRVLRQINPVQRHDVLVGLNSPDDAAVTVAPPGKVCVHTVDFFRSLINDPYVFGKIAANHCLGDVFAMGGEPQSALALAVVPYGLEIKMEEQLFQVMSGAAEVLAAHDTALVGGHTAEGPELAFGLAVNGLVDPKNILRKGGMQAGDRLILTKALGTGTLFAADMRRQAKGKWIELAVDSMLVSNRQAAQCLLKHQATACTDVTGFGLLGHLVEMAKASKAGVELSLAALPVLDGVLDTTRAGVFSSLQPQNLRLRRAIKNLEDYSRDERYPILFDPQTAGGLLASVPKARAEDCLAELKQMGYAKAAIIGLVLEQSEDLTPITLVSAYGDS